ncbi:MAG: hypothetical protein IJ940_01255 [Bacteroidales bacterium]|nr:hypothetical protein [Bacteroidales bacterium]
MRRFLIIISMLFLGALCAEAQYYDRGYELIPSAPFVKEGTWIAGGTARYSQHVNDDYSFLVISDINSSGYNISVNPEVLYVLKDNLGVGMRFSYDRSMLDLGSAGLSVSDISMSAEDCYQIQHRYSAHGVCRAYIPLGGSKRIAMFADLLLGGSFKQGKAYNAGGENILGTYQRTFALELAVDPGIVAFLTDRIAIDLNVGIFGLSYRWTNQIHNQVYNGHSDSASAGFMVNLLSIGVGMSYYFLR